MAEKPKGITHDFNMLLQVPYIHKLQCLIPDKVGDDQISILAMVLYFQKVYWDLQQSTAAGARGLWTYSETQVCLLQELVMTESVQPKRISVDSYSAANHTIIVDKKSEAVGIFDRNLDFQQQWDSAINSVKQEINNRGETIKRWKEKLGKLEQERKGLTSKAVRFGTGAILCFAAAAYLLGGFPISAALISGCVFLAERTTSTLLALSRLAAMIRELRARITAAEETKKNYEALPLLMETTAKNLAGITDCWKDIAQGLDDIKLWMSVITIPGMLHAMTPDLINAWKDIGRAVGGYLDVTAQS